MFIPLRSTEVLNHQLQKPLSGISQYGDFEYTGNGIVMRENTALGEGKLYTKALLNTLAKNNFTTTNASTGFELNLAKQVPNLLPNVMKAKVSVTPMKKSNKAQNSKNNSLRQCEECGKKFLPTGNLQRHKESKTCTSKRQSSSLAHKSASFALQITLSTIKEQCIKKEPEQVSEQTQKQLALELKGSAQRRVASKRKTARFTDKQKEIMD